MGNFKDFTGEGGNTMEKTIEIGLRENLLKELDSIAMRHGITREEWVKEVIIKALRSESARDKIMKVVSEEYMEGKIEFDDMVELIGIKDAKRIKSVLEGAKRSIEEASNV
ncbi:MAG: hypothetical protein R6U44_07310 [Archaeoglobaceae archaeon]